MHRIKTVSRRMLDEKLAEADVKDAESKRDIMSLLVRYPLFLGVLSLLVPEYRVFWLWFLAHG
jgi:hypothetical protein